MDEETVTIRKAEYEELLEKVEWLRDLRRAGVDNWGGMEEAIRFKRERLGDDY